MASTGTILQTFWGGEVHVWGSGISPDHNLYYSETAGSGSRAGIRLVPHAYRGPYTKAIIERAGFCHKNLAVGYGDPVWLLKRFYNPPVAKRHELGIIIHLSETDGRHKGAGALPYERYKISESDSKYVRIINTVTEVSSNGLRSKIDEILSCKRVISTSFHGVLLAERYAIPNFYLGNAGTGLKLADIGFDNLDRLDARVLDFFLSAGSRRRWIWSARRNQRIDFERLIRDMDKFYEPLDLSEESLIASFPLDLSPINNMKASDTFFDHPLISAIAFRHKVSDVLRESEERRAIEEQLLSLQ